MTTFKTILRITAIVVMFSIVGFSSYIIGFSHGTGWGITTAVNEFIHICNTTHEVAGYWCAPVIGL